MNTNSSNVIISYLTNIRENIQNVESRLSQESRDINEREIYNKNNDNKLLEVEELQNNIVLFNISGKLYPIDKNMLLTCEYDNILTAILKQKESNISEILIDRNRKLFRVIMDLIRSKYDQKKGRLPEGRIDYLVKCNHEALKEELAYYFKEESCDKIFEDFKLYYMDNNEIRILYGANTTINSLLINFTLSAPYPDDRLDIFRANTLDDINGLDSFKAIFADFESTLIFEFGDIVKCSSIELRPFWGDFDMWYPGNGADCELFYSRDGISWITLGYVPPDYGFDIESLHFIEFEAKEFKYIKFETKNNAFSIAYIKFT